MTTRKEISDLSKLAIATAMTELMAEKNYHDISITEIVARANVSRTAFYRNFENKKAVLAHQVGLFMAEYLAYSELPEGQAHRISHRNIKKAFQMFRDHEKFVLSCVEAGVAQCIPDAFSAYMRSNFANALPEGPGSVRRAYIMEAYASAVFTTAVAWLRRGAQEAPEEMADIIYAVYGEHI